MTLKVLIGAVPTCMLLTGLGILMVGPTPKAPSQDTSRQLSLQRWAPCTCGNRQGCPQETCPSSLQVSSQHLLNFPVEVTVSLTGLLGTSTPADIHPLQVLHLHSPQAGRLFPGSPHHPALLPPSTQPCIHSLFASPRSLWGPGGLEPGLLHFCIPRPNPRCTGRPTNMRPHSGQAKRCSGMLPMHAPTLLRGPAGITHHVP